MEPGHEPLTLSGISLAAPKSLLSTDRQVWRCPFREACVIKDEFGAGALLGQLEPNNRVDPSGPNNLTLRLDQSLVRHHFDSLPTI